MLCGDKIYNRTSSGVVMIDSSGAPRHALHSDRLAFKHPFSGENMQFNMPMPRDLAIWLARLQKATSANEASFAIESSATELNLFDEEE